MNKKNLNPPFSKGDFKLYFVKFAYVPSGQNAYSRGIHPPVMDQPFPSVTYVTKIICRPRNPAINRRATDILSRWDVI
jgi:hypothetical protein